MDQSMDSLFHRSQSVGAGGRGDNANARHLWAPAKTVNKFIGTINDTLEAERQATGPPPGPRLNLNFSSVRYDILTLGRGGHVDPSVRVPVKERKTIFDSPYPRGRRTAFDKGDTPFNILSLKSPRIPGLPVPVLPRSALAPPPSAFAMALRAQSERECVMVLTQLSPSLPLPRFRFLLLSSLLPLFFLAFLLSLSSLLPPCALPRQCRAECPGAAAHLRQ